MDAFITSQSTRYGYKQTLIYPQSAIFWHYEQENDEIIVQQFNGETEVQSFTGEQAVAVWQMVSDGVPQIRKRYIITYTVDGDTYSAYEIVKQHEPTPAINCDNINSWLDDGETPEWKYSQAKFVSIKFNRYV